jgi:hypothetical protein
MEHSSGTCPLPACTGYLALETWDGSPGGGCSPEMVDVGVLHLGAWFCLKTLGSIPGMVGAGVGRRYRLKNLGSVPGMGGAVMGRGRECLPSSVYSQHFTLFFPLSKKWILSSTLFFPAFRCRTNCNTFMDFFCAIAFDNNLFFP